MNLQDVFYIVAIVTMGIHILFIIVLISVLLVIQKKVSDLTKSIEIKAEMIKNYITHPNIIVTGLSSALFSKISHILKTKMKR